jgi:hypothetical protein
MTAVNKEISREIKLMLTQGRKGIYSHLQDHVDVLFCCTPRRLVLLLAMLGTRASLLNNCEIIAREEGERHPCPVWQALGFFLLYFL